MRIAFINAVCDSGSTGAICRELSESFVSMGNECILLYGNRDSDYKQSIKIAHPIEVKLNSLIARVTGFQGYFSYVSTYKCVRELERFMPDIVHIHNVHGNFINLNLLLAFLKRKHIRTVLTLHDCWFYTGKCTHYAEAHCYEWKKMCGNCPQLRSDIPSFWMDQTTRMLNDKKKAYDGFQELSVIAVSDWIANQARESILKNHVIQTIYNWVDLDVFKKEITKKDNTCRILCVGAKWDKDSPKMKDFIELARVIKENEELCIIGSLEKGIELPSNVVHIPYINGARELAEYYNKADVYVHLAREDSFGKVIIEAMACGTPVITYDSTVYPEIVGEGCGFVVDTGDIEQIVCRIREIWSVGKHTYSESCIQCAKKYEKKKIIEQTYAHYLMNMLDKHGEG